MYIDVSLTFCLQMWRYDCGCEWFIHGRNEPFCSCSDAERTTKQSHPECDLLARKSCVNPSTWEHCLQVSPVPHNWWTAGPPMLSNQGRQQACLWWKRRNSHWKGPNVLIICAGLVVTYHASIAAIENTMQWVCSLYLVQCCQHNVLLWRLCKAIE